MIWRAALMIGAILPCAASAQAPEVVAALPPTARLVLEQAEPAARLRVPVGPWVAGEAPTIIAEGRLDRRVWQVGSPGITTAQLIGPLRGALESAGYTVLLDCAARDCGGFSFRFATDAAPPPEMFVDLGDYRYLSAQASAADGLRWVVVMVSRTDTLGFVQITSVRPGAPDPGPEAMPNASAADARPPGPTELADMLTASGRAVLSDLAFETGAAELGNGPFAALDSLAQALRADPDLRIVLVGHTDSEGALPGNIDLSRRRAEAVRRRLIDAYGIEAARLRSDGVGYLAPLASNATPEGRAMNRRVEAVVDGSGG